MRERKQSFLERLSGTRASSEDTQTDMKYSDENVLSEKPWSPRVDSSDAEEESLRASSAQNETQEEEEHDTAVEETGDDDEAGLAVDMYEEDNELIIQCMIAGVMPENLHITITRDTVTIRGKRVPPQGIPEEQYVGRELYWGTFSREITLPFEVNTDGAEAVEKYGLLIIRLPRLDTTRAQELKVKTI